MKVLIDIKALFFNKLELEEALSNIRYNGITWKNIKNIFTNEIEHKLLSLPYNPQAISLLYNIYLHDQIILITESKYNSYAEQVCHDFKTYYNLNISYISYKTYEEKISIFKPDNIYIGYCVREKKIFDKVYESCLISDFINTFLFKIFIKNSKHTKSSFFSGLFKIPLHYMEIILSFLILWPSSFEIAPNIINQSRMVYSIVGTFLGFLLSNLTRNLVEIDNERKILLEGKSLLCSEMFIKSPTSIKIGLFYVGISIIGFILLMFKSLPGFIIGLSIFFVNFTTLLFPASIRYLLIFFDMFIMQIIFQPTFAKVIFKKLIS